MVRSAYRMLVATKLRREAWLDERPNSSNLESEQKLWTDMWSIQVPSKVNFFLWRLAHQSIPTADFLQRRKMAHVSSCGLCGSEDSWRHLLLECNMAQCVWAPEDEDLVQILMTNTEPDAKRWIFTLLDGLLHSDFVMILVTLWAIWHAKRKVTHESFKAYRLLTSSSRGT